MANIPPQQDKAYMRLVRLCEEIACGNYEKAKSFFGLLATEAGDTSADILAEAFGMMLVSIEAREFERERLLAEILSAREELERHRARLAVENRRLRVQVREQTAGKRLIGQDPAILNLLTQAENLALTRARLLITGETGAGKGVWARYIHDISPRAGKPFVDINCAAIPASLLESELFGIESGVASGVQARMGRFEQANGGTLLLDEIGDMPLESQAKILHVIEQGVVERVGGRKRIPVDVRIMAATHRNLEERVEQKKFRADLFYRLNVMQLRVPPLREHLGDIPLLARSILEHLDLNGDATPLSINAEALRLLMQYSWPGNVRELQNALERAALVAQNGVIIPINLPGYVLTDYIPESAAYAGTPAYGSGASVNNQAANEQAPPSKNEQTDLTLESSEAEHIRNVLALNKGNKSRTARVLGISREGLRIKLARYSIQ